MNENSPIIDVNPISHSSSRINSSARPSDSRQGAGSFRPGASPHAQGPAGAGQAGPRSPLSAVGGLAQMAMGAGLAAIGVPLLILPGPGLLCIGVGALLMARGASKALGMA